MVSRFLGLTSSLAALSIAAPHAFAAVECSADGLSALKGPSFSISSTAHVAPEGSTPAHCNVKGTVATALSRCRVANVKDCRPQQLSGSCDCGPPRGQRVSAKHPVVGGGDEVALGVERL
jgi:hypothetical protein